MVGKNKAAILAKLGIKALNAMQERAHAAISTSDEVVLLSPTGTGKTLAFLLPIIETLDPELQVVQAMVLVPSRELAIQIEQVFREMGSGYKATAVYGGRSGSKDKLELKHPPALLIGTPGRVADHIRRDNIETRHIKTLVLDEFDKSLEVGFTEEMKEIVSALRDVKKKVLTSATQHVAIPSFVRLSNPTRLNFLSESTSQLQLKSVVSPDKDRRPTLIELLRHIGKRNGIIFCNFKNSIQEVSDALSKQHIDHGCFHGGLEQIERERALIKFRNGSYNLLVATDLAARGIDVPEMNFIIHYELPHTEAEFTHRNGRSARMHSEGTAYVLYSKEQRLPEFINVAAPIALAPKKEALSSDWDTIFVSGGRKDKISKGDIAGLFFKQGQLTKEELGVIELKQDCAFVSVPRAKSNKLIAQLNNTRLKKKKVRITRIE
ncbi:MAG: DEAD/DEAH box helicase [Cyclobacteriaceae bacterium]